MSMIRHRNDGLRKRCISNQILWRASAGGYLARRRLASSQLRASSIRCDGFRSRWQDATGVSSETCSMAMHVFPSISATSWTLHMNGGSLLLRGIENR